ncbi:MAG: PAS domain S-box protein, partial [Promethearchaeota archaeon]
MLNNKKVNFGILSPQESEIILKTSIESLPFDVFIINKEGYYVMQNSICKEHWGDVIGKRPEDVANSEDTLTIWKDNNSKAFSGETVKGEVSFEINGVNHYFYNIISPVYINNEIEYIIGTNIDITAKMFAEQKVGESEEKYRHLYESSPNAILLVNMQGTIIDCNLASEKFSGFKREEMIGMNFAKSSFIPKEHIYSVMKDFKTLIKDKIPEPREIQLYTNKKKPVWVRYQASFCTIENDKVIQVIIEDISKRKKAEEKLKESEAKYHELFETSPDGVILTDLQGTILECNSAIERISGYSSAYFKGKNFLDLEIYLENALDQLKIGYKDLFGENLIEAIKFPIKTEDNEIKWVQVSSNLLNMKKKSYILAVIHDITGMKKAEEALKENEKKFRDILETSSVGIMEFDIINKKMLYINPKLLDIIGFHKEEITEKVFRQNVIHPNDLAKLL